MINTLKMVTIVAALLLSVSITYAGWNPIKNVGKAVDRATGGKVDVGKFVDRATGGAIDIREKTQAAAAESIKTVETAETTASKDSALATAKRELADASEAAQNLARVATEQQERAEALATREQQLLARQKELEQNEKLIKTGIFGCLATCVVGVCGVAFSTLSGRVDRRYRFLEILKLERELSEAGIPLESVPNYRPLYRRQPANVIEPPTTA